MQPDAITLWIEKEIRKFGADVVSVSGPYRWGDPTQKLLLNIIMSFAEFEGSLGSMEDGRPRQEVASMRVAGRRLDTVLARL
jgi:hypothetical protein